MISRYGLLLSCTCWIALTGCAGWKNQMGTFKPGSAASMPASGPAQFGAPAPSFNEPPPPSTFSPTSPNSVLSPLDGPQKLDLSSAPDVRAPVVSGSGGSVRPPKMYNLEKSSEPKVARSSSKSSTLSKLASAAGSKDKPSKTVASKPSESAVKRLSSEASVNSVPAPAEEAPASKPVAASSTGELPTPAAAPAPAAPQAAAEQEAIIDTTLLAQPVRKGANNDDAKPKESKGPQSRVMPGFKMFEGKGKPAIYPVSNPVSSEPVELIRFS